MIRKLRFRLVLASMVSLLVVLGVIIGGLNALNYGRIVHDADGMLAMLAENGGAFPAIDDGFEWPQRGPDYRSRELPFELRFFSVLLDGAGDALDTNVARIAAVDAESAQDYARQVFSGGGERGFCGIYRYLRREEDGGTRIVFLDCGRTLSMYHSVVRRSVVISAIGLAAVFLLIVLLSGRIVRPIARSYEKQKRFISDAGHEIKTPITIIDADTELLEMDLGDNEWLADIRQQAARLADLTSDLIFLSRMEEQSAATMIEFPVSDVIAEAAASFQAPARTRGLTLETDVAPMLSMTGNEKQIRQLVGVLLDNAIKYADSDSAIRLALKKQGRSLRLSVTNAAQGIQKETLDNMFERFYRGDPSRNSATRGYGIGLSIARAVAQAHRGRIFAECPDGRTLTVTAVLPAGAPDRGLPHRS